MHKAIFTVNSKYFNKFLRRIGYDELVGYMFFFIIVINCILTDYHTKLQRLFKIKKKKTNEMDLTTR